MGRVRAYCSSAVTGKVMASPVQQIPVSAGFQVNQEEVKENEIECGESIQKRNDEDAQETEVVKQTVCSQGDQETSQSQAHVRPKLRSRV